MKKIIFVLASLTMGIGVCSAAPENPVAISTSELADICGDQSNPLPQIYCDIYGQGVYDGYLVTRHTKMAPNFICVKQPAPPRRDVMNQFMAWIKENPIYNSAPAADSFLRFLAGRFSCESSGMSPAKASNAIVR